MCPKSLPSKTHSPDAPWDCPICRAVGVFWGVNVCMYTPNIYIYTYTVYIYIYSICMECLGRSGPFPMPSTLAHVFLGVWVFFRRSLTECDACAHLGCGIRSLIGGKDCPHDRDLGIERGKPVIFLFRGPLSTRSRQEAHSMVVQWFFLLGALS